MQRCLNKCGNTIQLYKVYETENSVYMIIEYQSGGTLQDLIKTNPRLSETELRTIIE